MTDPNPSQPQARQMDTLNDVLRIVAESGQYDVRGLVVKSMLPISGAPGLARAIGQALVRQAHRVPDERTLRYLQSEQAMALLRERRDMVMTQHTNPDGSTTRSFKFNGQGEK